MTDYDRWLEKPYAEQAEAEECPECEGTGTQFIPDDRPEEVPEACERCEGTGYVDPPTQQDIDEARADQRFDQERDEGRI